MDEFTNLQVNSFPELQAKENRAGGPPAKLEQIAVAAANKFLSLAEIAGGEGFRKRVESFHDLGGLFKGPNREAGDQRYRQVE